MTAWSSRHAPALFRSPAGEEHGEVTLLVPGRAPAEILRPNGDEYKVFELVENRLPDVLIYEFTGVEQRR